MKKFVWILFPVIFILPVSGQQDVMAVVINEISSDSLVRTVRDLSGEDSVTVGGLRVMIQNRINGSVGNTLAGTYIRERLTNYHLNVTEQIYREHGRNLIATQPGQLCPDSLYMICAHYDAMADHCADDNAGGVAAVIEAARVLSGRCFANSIVYALWDEEELNLTGSRNYVQLATAQNMRIKGVINLDIIGYDANNDARFDLNVNNDSVSSLLADSVLSVLKRSGILLIADVIKPGNRSSDQASFWNANYGAVAFYESLSTAERTPFIHTSDDRIDKMNINYFTNQTKLAIGTLCALSVPVSTSGWVRGTIAIPASSVRVYPNPTHDFVYIEVQDDGETVLQVVDFTGRTLATKNMAGRFAKVDLGLYPPGVYSIVIFHEGNCQSRLILKK